MKKLIQKFRYRKMILAVADAFIVVISALLANFLLSNLGKGLGVSDLRISMAVSVCCCGACLMLAGAYNKLWRYFNVKDYLSCVYGVVAGDTAACLLVYIIRGDVPVTYAVLHGGIIVIGICLFRYIFKQTFIELTACGTVNDASYDPVCIIDDDTAKIGTAVQGVPVVGTTDELLKYTAQMQIQQIIFSIPSCLDDERQRILDICAKANLPVKVMPFISELIFEENTLLRQMHDIKVEDLLGREPIKFDNQDIRAFISGKVCMVTGGGGSIGSELVRQIAKYDPKQIIIVDIYENNAYDIQQELKMEYGDDLDLVTLIASVRDYFRMNQIMERYKPEIVFHAAAHKHVPLMEVSPMEAIKNNVVGTFNVASLAQFHNVQKFVMISTDKAVNPTNVMGASKRCCEMIIQYLSQEKDGVTEFVTTRFGNVLGSNGSVIPLFKREIEQGKPVTVTHPDIIRYFMTIPEAVSLVMEAAAIAHGGEIFVLDMGKPWHWRKT